MSFGPNDVSHLRVLRSHNVFAMEEAYRIATWKRGAKSTLLSTIRACYRKGAKGHPVMWEMRY
ncbi:hypothetical protein KSD_80700 [Ktedonobacter sp. SOSP1-85]|nr:hypothetical protein KSD_80700 [Ktedonobacter sp. SOSP1-85]